MGSTYKKKSKGIAYLLWLFFGFLGGHRFYIGDYGKGIAMALTCGGFMFWWALDFFSINRRVYTKNIELQRLEQNRRAEEFRLENLRRQEETQLQNQIRQEAVKRHAEERRIWELETAERRKIDEQQRREQRRLEEQQRQEQQRLEEEVKLRERKLEFLRRQEEVRLQEEAWKLEELRRENEIKLQNQIREQRIRESGIFQIDEMTGEDFEEFLYVLYKGQGYNVELTPKTGDFGADLILTKNNRKIAVQAKRYKDKVGVGAIQEIHTAKSYYEADECWVVTNNYYTDSAVKLAASSSVVLIDRDNLIGMLVEKNQGA